MTDDWFERSGSYRSKNPEKRLRMEDPYGDRHYRSDSRDRGGSRNVEEREGDRHTGRYRDGGYRGGSRRTNDGYLASHDQRGYDQYPSRAGYGRQGYDDGYELKNEAPQRLDERERVWNRQNDGGGRQHDRGRHQDYHGRDEQDYRGYGGSYDYRYEKDSGRYGAHHPRRDYGYGRRDERYGVWGDGDGGNVTHGHGRDQRYGSRYDRHDGGYSPRGRGRRSYDRDEVDYDRSAGRNDMDIDRYARNSKPSGDRGYGDGGRSPRGKGENEPWDEWSATGALSPGAHSDSDPLLKGEYMFGYAVLPPQIWEDVPTDHGTSESDGEITSDHPTSGMRRKLDNLDLDDSSDRVKRVRHE